MTRPRVSPRREEAHSLENMGNSRISDAQERLNQLGNDEGDFDFNEEFRKFATTSREGGRSVWKLVHNIANSVDETFPIYLSVLLPLINNDSLESVFSLEVLGSIVLHVVCVCIRFVVEYSNESTFRSLSRWKILMKFIVSLLLLNKPIRYWHRFQFRYKKAMLLDDFLNHQRDLSKEDIKAVIEMNNLELKDSEYEMTEVHVQALPMAVFQLYIIFSNNESFTVCSWADVTRLWFFVACVYSAAKATKENSAMYSASMKSFLFLYKFEHPSHPVNLQPECCCTSLLVLSRNFLFTLHRFYCISFFLAVNPYLAIVYVASVLVSQWLMLQFLPEQMRLPFENPPYGIHTFSSEALQQWINLFSNYRSKLDWVSYRGFKICGFKFQMFLGLLHIIPFVASMAVTFSAASFLGDSSVHQMTDSFNGINRTEPVQSCPGVNKSLAFLPEWANEITKYAFKAHSDANHRFTSFKEVFGAIHFLPFSMYYYFVVTFTYSYYLNQFRLINALFPVLQGYRMFHGLVFAILSNQSTGKDYKRRMLRRLMLLTQIVDDSQFYLVYRQFMSEKLCNRRGAFNQVMSDIMTECVRKITKSVDDIMIDLSAIACGQGSHKHPLSSDFASMIHHLETEDEKKIFLVFYAYFDNRIRDWSSNRAKATFNMMGISLDAYKYHFDCTV